MYITKVFKKMNDVTKNLSSSLFTVLNCKIKSSNVVRLKRMSITLVKIIYN